MSSKSFGIYLHIPFCVSKCPYCDFVSGQAGEEERLSYLEAVEAELRASPWCGRPARTVYFGGGTPSALSPAMLARFMAKVQECFPLESGAECSIECNPGTLGESKLAEMRAIGFNRLSLGVQSFSDRFLRRLGRIHTADEARDSFRLARTAGFDNVSLDLIFQLPGQTLEDWRDDLQAALELRPDHLSLYGLTVEPETEFGRLKAHGLLEEIEEELAAAMYETAVEMTDRAGYEQYEISNFALPGRQCRHNLIYWHNEEYLGFGVSAASYVDGVRSSNEKDRQAYVDAVAGGRLLPDVTEQLGPRAALGEEIMLRLRLAEGFSCAELRAKYGLDPEMVYSDAIDFFLGNGLLDHRNGSIRLTARGRLLASEVCRRFL